MKALSKTLNNAYAIPTVIFVGSFLFSLQAGAINIPVLNLLYGTLSPNEETVLTVIRLPRVLLSCIVGASLAVAGAALQGLFRNPLADPGIIGVSSGSALAVGVAIVLVEPSTNYFGTFALSTASFLGGLLATFLIFSFAGTHGKMSVVVMLLAGIAFNSIAGAGMGFLHFISDDQQLRTLSFWAMGGLGGALWSSVVVAGVIAIPSCYFLARQAHSLNVMTLGDSEAKQLGVDSKRVRRSVIIWSALAVGAAVSVSGIIGFVGLVVPHFVRLVIGADHKIVIPVSAILGAALLALADSFARTMMIPAELPVGVLTSLIGGPCFLWFLYRDFGHLRGNR